MTLKEQIQKLQEALHKYQHCLAQISELCDEADKYTPSGTLTVDVLEIERLIRKWDLA